MDPFGCQDRLFVTDNAFDLHLDAPCETPLLAFIVSLIVLILAKTRVVVGIWQSWFAKRNKLAISKKCRVTRRYPFVPVLTSVMALLYVLMLTLVGANLLNATNGGAVALYCAMCFLWGLYSLFFVKKYVRLGRRLIPLAAGTGRTPFSSPESVLDRASLIEIRLRMLNSFDFVLKILVCFQILVSSLILVFGCFFGLAFPNRREFMRIAFGLVGVNDFMFLFTLVYQSERLAQATQYSLAVDSQLRTEEASKAMYVVRMMRLGQMTWMVCGNISTILHWLIAANVLSAHWYVIMLLMLIETAASSFAFFSLSSKTKKSADVALDAPNNNKLPTGTEMVVAENPLHKNGS